MAVRKERTGVNLIDIAEAIGDLHEPIGDSAASKPFAEESSKPNRALQTESRIGADASSEPCSCLALSTDRARGAGLRKPQQAAVSAGAAGRKSAPHPAGVCAAGTEPPEATDVSPVVLTRQTPARFALAAPLPPAVAWRETPWFRLLFGDFPDAIYLLDPHDPALLDSPLECASASPQPDGALASHRWSLAWPIVCCNDTAARRSGYSPGELSGQPAGLIGPRVERRELITGLFEVLRRSGCARFPAADQHKNGALVPVEAWATLVHTDGRELVLIAHRDLTAQHQAEALLERHETLARLHPAAFLELAPDGSLAYANEAAERLARSFGERSPAALLPPGACRIAAQCLETGRSRINLLAQAGGRALNWSFSPVKARQTVAACGCEVTANGAAAGADPDSPRKLDEMLALLRRLSDSIHSLRPEVSEAGHERQEAELVQTATEAFVTLDKDGGILSFNPAAERLTGYTAGELLGKNFARAGLLDPDSLLRMLEKFDQFVSGRATRPIELVLLRKDRQQVLVEANVWAARRAGRIAGAHMTWRDITERKRGEEALRKREACLAVVERISRIGSWETNAQDGASVWSEEMFRLLGLAPNAAAPGHASLLKLVHPSCREMVAQTYEQAAKEGKPYSVEYRVTRADGSECWVLEQADVIFNGAGEVTRLVGTVQDITRRKQQEEQLRQVEKWEAIGRLAGGVAHDFNHILADIRKCARALQDHPGLGADLAEQIRKLSSATEQATALTWNLLAHSRRQPGQFNPVDVNEVITQVAKTLRPVLGAGMELKLNLAAELPAIQADACMLEQVLMGPVVHARQNLRHNGQVVIESRAADVDLAYVQQQPEARVGRFVCISITDTGLPEDASTASWLFEPFFTTRDTGARGCLGLATVYSIVKQHQGWVDVVGRLEQGRTCRIYLPAQATKPPPPHTDTDTKPAWGGTETILLAEHEPLLRSLTQSILDRYGYRVLAASSGNEARGLWERHQADIRLLVVNLSLAGDPGAEDLAARLQAQSPRLRVLYTSEYRARLSQHQCQLKVGVNFLPKPCSATAIAQAVRQCLDSPGTT